MPNGNDVSQEVILSFLELDQEKQRQIIEGGYLEFWAIRAAMFTNSNTGKFGKYFSRQIYILACILQTIQFASLISLTKDFINSIYFFLCFGVQPTL